MICICFGRLFSAGVLLTACSLATGCTAGSAGSAGSAVPPTAAATTEANPTTAALPTTSPHLTSSNPACNAISPADMSAILTKPVVDVGIKPEAAFTCTFGAVRTVGKHLYIAVAELRCGAEGAGHWQFANQQPSRTVSTDPKIVNKWNVFYVRLRNGCTLSVTPGMNARTADFVSGDGPPIQALRDSYNAG